MAAETPIGSLFAQTPGAPSPAVLATAGSAASTCVPATFDQVKLYGADILSVTATVTEAKTPPVSMGNFWPIKEPITVEVCNVTVQYTHPGWDDTINTSVYLPVSADDWNERMLGIGGGGWIAGQPADLVLPASKGFAAVATDAGHHVEDFTAAPDWVMTKDGSNVNWHALQNFASVAVNDAATLGKEVVSAFYGSKPKKSYFTGCSTGGRQGHMLAQRYSTQYDGILGVASAFNWDKFLPAEYWPYIAMKINDYYPAPCELAAIGRAAIAACDAQDGVEDGIIADEKACDFEPHSVVGQAIECPELSDQKVTISEGAAKVAAAIWQGPRDDQTGEFLWYGHSKAANFLLATTKCSTSSSSSFSCTPQVVFPIPADYLRLFVSHNKSLDLSTLTYAEYTKLFRLSVNTFSSIMGSADPDLSSFKRAGGKMITWHGTTDPLIPLANTEHYYNRVLELDPDAGEFYRYFEAPGVDHCFMGEGWYPGDALDALIDWVEKDEAPKTLYAENAWATKREPGSRKINLCAYPKRLKFLGGDPDVAESWTCVSREGKQESSAAAAGEL